MGFVTKLMGNGKAGAGAPVAARGVPATTANGALDTLGSVLRTCGEFAFQTDSGQDVDDFRAQCEEVACHVENGGAMPSLGIDGREGGERSWGHVRRFYIDRRQHEQAFVNERLNDYRGVVEDLVSSLRELGQRDDDTARCVRLNLDTIESAVATGRLPEIKSTLNDTVRNIAEGLAHQKREYERRIGEMNQRMASLRQDLVSVREEMKRDPLTGAFNRGAFDQAVIHSLNINFILAQPVTMMFIDLDHFKQINDNYGHAAGDEVLRGIGDALARTFIRKTDIVARFGGDEFAVILADTTAANAASLLDRYYSTIAEIQVPYAGDDIRVGCSTGYTEVVAGDTVDTLLKRADRALYAAKEAGRGCYKFAPPPQPAATAFNDI